jgi:ceramide glucosyltransferase
MDALAIVPAILSIIGIAQSVAGWIATVRFATQPPASSLSRPPVTVLKPLHGDEPLLEQALTTLCKQDYPAYQIVFGVQAPDDSALSVVERLRAAFPRCDIAVIVDTTQHGPNRKVSNLINMYPAAKYDVLAIADSDLHVRPDYLADLATNLATPGVGLVTTLYVGRPATACLPALLGASQITHGFLPGALLARAMGRQDCLGATMCLRRDTLTRIGGLHALVDHLADDNVLGQLVRRLGLTVRLAGTVVETTVPETTFAALFRHELRWARTIRALVPGAFALSVLQYPIFWALIAFAVSGGAVWAAGLFFLAWIARAAAAMGIDAALAPRVEMLAFPATVGLLPLRELLSVATMLASHAGKSVDWRGHTMHAAGYDATLPSSQPGKGLHTR